MRFTFSPGHFFPNTRSRRASAAVIAAMLMASPALLAQDTTTVPQATAPQATAPQTPAPSGTDAAQTSPATANATLSATPGQTKKKSHITKEERVVQTKDTKAELRKQQKYNPLVGKDANLPDKQLYDKALLEEKKGHFDVARLDLQTLLNTYPESQYIMRAKLAVANSWFEEGGSAAMAQAEQEYGDFITFFPNVPEAAEAQMRMGDIYLKQMDVPDRDYSKALKAEEQYRLMLKTYPDAPASVHKEAEQKLRDVQEVMAEREFELAQFYSRRNNMAATIARYQTVANTYPLFSHMDDTLIGLGDSYEADANLVRSQPSCEKPGQTGCINEAAKAKLEEEYDGKAAGYYRDVVLNHAAAPHVEDAKERLQAMNLPLPTPTAAQVAASDALEGSRAQYTLRKRLQVLFVRRPDTVTAAQLGQAPLEDPPATVAPTIVHQFEDDYRVAFNPAAAHDGSADAAAGKPAPETSASEGAAVPSPAPGISTPLALTDVPAAGSGAGSDAGSVREATPVSAGSGGGTGVGNGNTGVGVEVLTPGVVQPGSMTGAPVTGLASDRPAATGAADANYGIVSPKPADNSPLPAAEAPAAAPDVINEAAGKPQPAAAQAANPNSKKKPKPEFDKNDESSSKHKKKKGLSKLNPL